LLEAVATQGGYTNPDSILLTLHNSGFVYQHLGHMEECANYLDGCLYNVKHRRVMAGDEEMRKQRSNLIAIKLKKLKY
jgi:hypothetical protein